MKSAFPRIMLVLVFLALVANVVVTAVKGDSFISKDMLFKLLFAGLVVSNLSISGAALYFTSKAIQKNERSALKWSRRGFIANVGITLIFGAAPWMFFPSTSATRALVDCSFLLLLLGSSNGIFAFAAYRDYVRSVGSHGAAVESRRRRKAAHRTGSEDAGSSWEE